MRTAARNRTMLAFVLTLLSAAVMVGTASTAHADDCLALGGNPAFLPGECRIDAVKTASDAAHGGPFTISEPLRVTGDGEHRRAGHARRQCPYAEHRRRPDH